MGLANKAKVWIFTVIIASDKLSCINQTKLRNIRIKNFLTLFVLMVEEMQAVHCQMSRSKKFCQFIDVEDFFPLAEWSYNCLLYTSPSPRDS